MITIGLVHGAGQTPEGEMYPETEKNCRVALQQYWDGDIDHLYLYNDEMAAGKCLGERMLEFLMTRLGPNANVELLTTGINKREPMKTCRYWAERCFRGETIKIIEIGHKPDLMLAQV